MNRKWLLPLVGYTLLTACETFQNTSSFGGGNASGRSISQTNSGSAVEQGRSYFADRQYRKAATAYQSAVKVAPDDMNAWLGLAASFDMVGKGLSPLIRQHIMLSFQA